MKNKLSSLSIFFPFLNDEGTVPQQIADAYYYGKKVTDNLEVIAINGGKSKDDTFEAIKKMKLKYPDLKIIDRTENTEGYAVIKHGFWAASKDWIFYTDGDRQYHLDELEKLVSTQMQSNADIVNGYKTSREDNVFRHFFGEIYRLLSKLLFQLPIRDTDCDFRLIRNSIMQQIDLTSTNASILPEMIKKLELKKAKFVEIPVQHYARTWSTSNYTTYNLLKEKLLGDLKLWRELRKFRG
ncbi:MAG: glycosyltransferase family 2 protein [bacterium]